MFRRFLLVLAMALPVLAAAKVPPAEVAVLATLHQLHATTPAYSFETLGQVIERLQPEVLCVELQPDDLQRRPAETTKQESTRVVYPLIARHHYPISAYGSRNRPRRSRATAMAPTSACRRTGRRPHGSTTR